MSRSTREVATSLPARDRAAGGSPAATNLVLLAALFAVTVWAGTPIATKLAVGELDPLAVGLLRTLLGALLAVPLLGLRRHAWPASSATRRLLLLSAFGGFVLFPLLFSVGVEKTTAGHAALALALLPILTGLMAAGAKRRRLSLHWWCGSAIALVGTWLLIDRRFGLASPGASLQGDAIVLLSCVAASAGYVAGARAARDIGSEAVTFWGLAIGGLALCPALPWILDLTALAAATPATWGAVAYLGSLSSIIAYASWYWALAKGDIGRTGHVQFLQPFLGLLFAVVLLGENLTWPLVLAGIVIVAGVALARNERSKLARPQRWASISR